MKTNPKGLPHPLLRSTLPIAKHPLVGNHNLGRVGVGLTAPFPRTTKKTNALIRLFNPVNNVAFFLVPLRSPVVLRAALFSALFCPACLTSDLSAFFLVRHLHEPGGSIAFCPEWEYSTPAMTIARALSQIPVLSKSFVVAGARALDCTIRWTHSIAHPKRTAR
jgi:hypothetical protein